MDSFNSDFEPELFADEPHQNETEVMVVSREQVTQEKPIPIDKFRKLPDDINFFRILNDCNPSNHTELQADFTAYISIASTVPIQKWFLIITLATVIVLNISTGLLQAALCGILMKFPLSYISAFSSGQSLAGILAAVALIFTSAENSFFENSSPIISTFSYFLIADILILISIFGYLTIRRTEFYKFHINEVKNNYCGSIQYERLGVESTILPSSIKYTVIWIPCIGLFLCYFVTTCVYPAVAVLVSSVNIELPSQYNEIFFVPVVTFLLYCICEYLGRIFAGYIQKPSNISFIFLGLLRIVFIPLIMFCNAEPRHHLPVLINSDLLYIVIIIGLALSNGYLTNLTFIITPKFVALYEQETASTMLIIWLSVALSFGSLLSFSFVNLL
ncbi:hypothetical protein PGB90_004926 [Kerria lacca]